LAHTYKQNRALTADRLVRRDFETALYHLLSQTREMFFGKCYLKAIPPIRKAGLDRCAGAICNLALRSVAERFYYREKNPQWSTESFSMAEQNGSSGNTLRLFIYWLIVGVPFVWGVWITILKLPALFR
jgi:hypothetical protein